jgi:hypothetical protein
MIKKLCFNFLYFLPLIVLLNSCSNELEVLGDYEENAAVYGLLDPRDNVQLIKINKVFTNPNAKASDVAQISDSLFFDTLSPELVELETGRRIPLFKANVLLKDSGFFANSPNYLYATTERVYANNPNNVNQFYNYRLEFRMPKTGKQISVTTNMVRNFNIQSPFNSGLSFIPRTVNFVPNSNLQLRFLSPANGKIFDAFFNFNYTEINLADTNIKVEKTIRWKILRSYRTQSVRGNEAITALVPGINFYNILLDEIKEDVTVFRRFSECSLEVYAGNLELDNYIQASTPSIGIVQKQTDYSNVNGGVGVFASRNTLFLDGVNLTDFTKNLIVLDDKYKQLGFVKD